MQNVPKLTMTVKEMAQALGVSLPVAYDLVNKKGFPAFRLGRKILVRADGLNDWIRRNSGA